MRARSHQPPGRGPLVAHAARGSTISKTLMLDRCRQYGDLRLLEVTEERNGPSGLRDDDDDDDDCPSAVCWFLQQTGERFTCTDSDAEFNSCHHHMTSLYSSLSIPSVLHASGLLMQDSTVCSAAAHPSTKSSISDRTKCI